MSGAGGAGRVIRLVDVATGKLKAELRGHLEDISSLAFTPDGQTLLSASDDGTIRVWDVVPRAKEKSAHPFAPELNEHRLEHLRTCALPFAGWPPSAHRLHQSNLQHLGHAASRRRRTPSASLHQHTIAAVAPGGRLAAFANWRGEVMLWDVATGQARFFARPGTNRIHRLVFSLDGRYLAIADDTKTLSQMAATPNDPRRTVRVWDVAAQKETHVFSPDGEIPVSLTFSADGKALMAGCAEGRVKLWPLDGPGEVATFPGHPGWVDGLALLPDGQTLISAGAGHSLLGCPDSPRDRQTQSESGWLCLHCAFP